jgi:hypothetical protein
MGEAIPRQHPAVALRSHFNVLRALLAAAVIAVIGLSVAVVILATDDDQVASTSSAAKPIGSINYGDSTAVNPSTGHPTVPLSQLERANAVAGIRYDGGPDEGTRGVARAPQATVTPETQIKDEAGTAAAIGRSSSSSATETKNEAGTAAAIGQSNSSSATETKNEAGTAAAIGQSNSSSATETKDEAGTAAAIGQSSDLRGGKASQWGTSQYRLANP